MDMSAKIDSGPEAQDTGDQTLAGRACNGDRAAFAALVTRHYDFIHRVAWKWCRDRTVAEDIAQTVCLKLGTAIFAWRNEGSFTTWLYRLTINAAHDNARAATREMRKAQSWADHAVALSKAPDEGEDGDADALWAAVRTLPEKQRDAVLLVYGEELNHADAASIMGCAESTVSYHLHAARKRLKRLLNEAGEEQ